jgi:hypothetical protein
MKLMSNAGLDFTEMPENFGFKRISQ